MLKALNRASKLHSVSLWTNVTVNSLTRKILPFDFGHLLILKIVNKYQHIHLLLCQASSSTQLIKKERGYIEPKKKCERLYNFSLSLLLNEANCTQMCEVSSTFFAGGKVFMLKRIPDYTATSMQIGNVNVKTHLLHF